MDFVFLDSNALVKLYRPEKGSTWLEAFIRDKQVIISELAFFESATTLGRLYREGTYSKIEASRLYSQIWRQRASYRVIPLRSDIQRNRVVSMAFNLPTNLRLRALDGLQLAAANLAQKDANNQQPVAPFTFVSSDVQLLRVAQAQNLSVENPEDYP